MIFVPGTTGSAVVKMFSKCKMQNVVYFGVKNVQPLVKKCDLVCFGVRILNVVYFGVKKIGN